jgi:hypothetical protein
MHSVSVKLVFVRDSLLEVLKECHQNVHSAPLLCSLVLHLVDDALDVLDSSFDGIQRLVENVHFYIGRVSSRERRRRT